MASRSAIEETYKDVKGLLRLACWKIYCIFPNCEMDELMGEANYLYVRYFDKHPPHYDFGLWIYLKVLYCLMDRKKVEVRRSKRVGMVVYHALEYSDQSMDDWTEGLCTEDIDIIRLVLRMPKTSERVLENKLLSLGWEPIQIQASIGRIKEQRYGW